MCICIIEMYIIMSVLHMVCLSETSDMILNMFVSSQLKSPPVNQVINWLLCITFSQIFSICVLESTNAAGGVLHPTHGAVPRLQRTRNPWSLGLCQIQLRHVPKLTPGSICSQRAAFRGLPWQQI